MHARWPDAKGNDVGTRGDPAPFTIRVDELDDGTVLRLAGDLDMAGVPALNEALEPAQRASTSRLVVDLRGLTFLDSMGLSALIAAHAAGQGAHVEIAFVRGEPVVHRIFEITKMDDRLEWVDAPD